MGNQSCCNSSIRLQNRLVSDTLDSSCLSFPAASCPQGELWMSLSTFLFLMLIIEIKMCSFDCCSPPGLISLLWFFAVEEFEQRSALKNTVTLLYLSGDRPQFVFRISLHLPSSSWGRGGRKKKKCKPKHAQYCLLKVLVTSQRIPMPVRSKTRIFFFFYKSSLPWMLTFPCDTGLCQYPQVSTFRNLLCYCQTVGWELHLSRQVPVLVL